MMDTTAPARRLGSLQSHLQGGCRGGTASGIEMQDCAASSAVAFARPAADDMHYARAERNKGKARQQEVALRAAESVLGSSLIPVNASAAHKVSPAFAKASGEDARMEAAAADAHAASARSLRAAARQPTRAQRQSGRESAESLPLAVSRTTKRSAGLRADALQSSSAHTLQVALPGICAEDLRIEVEGRRLTISGWRPLVSFIPARSAHLTVHRQEHGLPPKPKHGHFVSVWRLPADADTRRASAELDNGMLRVTFSRTS